MVALLQAGMPPKEQQGVDLNALDPEQLASVQQQLEEEIQGLAQSSVALQKAAGEFGKSGRAVEALGQQKEGKCAPCMQPFPDDITLAIPSGTSSTSASGELATCASAATL